MRHIYGLCLVAMMGCADRSPESRQNATSQPGEAMLNGGTPSTASDVMPVATGGIGEPSTSDASSTGADQQNDDSARDTGTGQAAPQPNESRAYGAPCRSNLDCESEFCIATPRGFICSKPCAVDDDCADAGGPMSCRYFVENFGPDGQRICTPDDGSLCQPCFRDDHCYGGRCLSTPQGNVCTVACGPDEGCPADSTCRTESEDGVIFEVPQCIPDLTRCTCGSKEAGQTRACVRIDEESGGRCFGEEICDPESGWTRCDAPSPVPEMCDGIDNDCNGAIDDGLASNQPCTISNESGRCSGVEVCAGEAGWTCVGPTPADETCDTQDNDCDGVIDETFKNDEGIYATSSHCGGCQIDCAALNPLATDTDCIIRNGQAECVAIACRNGFIVAEMNKCLPLASKLCAPCENAEQCNVELGDACVDYGGGQQFCGRDCGPDSPFGAACPVGFICSNEGQCRREAGTCSCGENDNFLLPCTVSSPSNPEQICVGTQACADGTLGECTQQDEQCDGLDDDCDGPIDEDFTDPNTGEYNNVRHCGRCNRDCTAEVGEAGVNGEVFCETEGGEARCGLRCEAGFANVNLVVADGCECAIQDPNNDAPDAAGVDANCDGIDGMVARGIFVAPAGDDQAPGTRARPMKTIQAAILRADDQRDHVYVAAGVYSEVVTLRTGVSVFGGYSADYSRRDVAGNETALFAPATIDGIRQGTVNAFDITDEATLFTGFTVVGHTENIPGRSAYAIYVRDCNEQLVIAGNIVRSGHGGAGTRGASGVPGIDAPDNAVPGEPERISQADVCIANDVNLSRGGQGSRHSCVDANQMVVRTDGGNGGTADCPIYDQAEGSGTSGSGANGAGQGGAGGYNQLLNLIGFFGPCACLVPSTADATEVGVPGQSGPTGALGDAGRGCDAGEGSVIDGQWVSGNRMETSNRVGTDGGTGQPGGGGGGGGAGSGVQFGTDPECNDTNQEVIGGGGGGAGAGGCGGTGGRGGGSGGGSFGIFLYYTADGLTYPDIRDNRIERGFGGAGGDGGEGGEGGSGSLGKEGNALTIGQQMGLLSCADPGGRGGDGGEGGDGGGGGGGCGGITAGIYIFGGQNRPDINLAELNQFPPTGAAGSGGRGGLSLGQQGEDGADGQYVEVVQ